MAGDDKSNSLHDTALGYIILLVVAAALCWLIWYFLQYQIKSGVRWVRWAEMKAVSLFVEDDYKVQWQEYNADFHQWLDQIPKLPNQALDSQTMSVISALSQEPLKWPAVILLGLMGLWAYMFGPKSHFRRKLGLEGLIMHQSTVFPIISPFLKFNPGKQPPRPPGSPVPAELPLFAEALGPEEWLAYNSIPVPDGNVDAGAAAEGFARQLGPPWRGASKLPPYKQILVAAFCLKASRKRSEADQMLGRLAKCWSAERGLRINSGLLKEARSILKNQSLAQLVLSRCNQHGFETTALLRALATAREEGGVLAPAQFLWLRAYDRALWYPLNNLGRQSFHMEALGAVAHYKAEKLTQRPIPRPKIEFAVETITEYMKSLRARPIPQLDYSGSKKRAVKKPKTREGGTPSPQQTRNA